MNKKIALLCISLITTPVCASEEAPINTEIITTPYVLVGLALINRVFEKYQNFRTTGKGPQWLFDAVEDNNMRTMNLLLLLGVDPNITRKEKTLLAQATYERNPYAVERLLQYGAVDNPNTKKFMALHCCFTKKYVPDILLALLKNGSKNYIPEKKEALCTKALADNKALKHNHQISPPDDDLWPLPNGKERISACRQYIFDCYMFSLKP